MNTQIELGCVGSCQRRGRADWRSIISGFDYDARPIIYMRPGRENTETSPRQIRHLIFNLYVAGTLKRGAVVIDSSVVACMMIQVLS
jgi:hypothetical protein